MRRKESLTLMLPLSASVQLLSAAIPDAIFDEKYLLRSLHVGSTTSYQL
jgi:hypothetical protein